jgi:hypothetical protein
MVPSHLPASLTDGVAHGTPRRSALAQDRFEQTTTPRDTPAPIRSEVLHDSLRLNDRIYEYDESVDAANLAAITSRVRRQLATSALSMPRLSAERSMVKLDRKASAVQRPLGYCRSDLPQT